MIRSIFHATLIFIIVLVPAFAEVPPLINYQGKISVGGVDFNGNGQFKFALVNGGVNLSQSATATTTVVNGFVVGATINSGGVGYTSAPTVTISGAGTGAQLTATVSGGVVTGIQVVNSGSGYQAVSTTITVAPPAPNLAITTYWSNDGSSTGGSQPTQSISLPVASGGYSVLLGDAQIPNMLPIPIEAFKNDDVRLRVWFSDGNNGFQLMTPDQRISAVGYAMIAASVPDGAITSTQLANGAVTGSKIATGSVAANQLASGAVSADKLATGAVSSDKIATGAISSDQLATGAVTSDKLASGAVNTDKLADGAVGAEKLGAGAVTLASARDGNVLLTANKRTDLENQGFVMIGSLNHTTLRVPYDEGDINITNQTTIWTGTEMIAWGGTQDGTITINTGSRYNTTTNIWKSTNTTGAPTARARHTAIWTGTEMIVWGGRGNDSYRGINTGGRYNPTTDTWTAISTVGAPSDFLIGEDTAIWTGTEMIVWGILNDGNTNTGYRYNPITDSWTAISISGALGTRQGHTAVWTGNKMIVWGGYYGYADYNTGGLYNPANNTWTATSTNGAPTHNGSLTSFWTGTEMIVVSSSPDFLSSRYNPISDTWTQISKLGFPSGCSYVWTGKEMILWGGTNSANNVTYNTGFCYSPETDTLDKLIPAYLELSAANFSRQTYASDFYNIKERYGHSAIWAGTGMILYGGRTHLSTARVKTEIILPNQSYIYSKP